MLALELMHYVVGAIGAGISSAAVPLNIGWGFSLTRWLAVLMLVNSVISVFYYFAGPRQMIFKPATDESPLRPSWLVTAVVGFAALAILALFILPNPFARLADLSTLIPV